jgi:CRISPR-associated exonuclease Cas4
MKSLQSFSESAQQVKPAASVREHVFITPSDVIEYLYCPRFTFFENCLNIPEHQEQRYKVLKGREVHEEKAKINREYLRKKLGCVSKDVSAYLASSALHLRGEIDEILEFSDGTLAPLDYKFAEYRDWVFQTHKYQSALYALLIMENYGKDVTRGYVCYIRSKNFLKEIQFCNADFKKAKSLVSEILDIISKGYYPKKKSSPAHCIDCCYKNICV